MSRAPLVEIFSSIQGEGRHVGRPMTFLRVAACPVRCSYCDTPNSYRAPDTFPVAVGGQTEHHKNPVTPAVAVDLTLRSAKASPFGRTKWVSITGGEPLLYPDFVRDCAADLRSEGMRLLLETAALDSQALAKCIDRLDHVSADLKLPGTLVEGDADAAMLQSLECARVAVEAGVTVDVKVVVTVGADEGAFDGALHGLMPLASGVQLILQPVTPFGDEVRPCPADKLARFMTLASRAGLPPLVIPQAHKSIGLP